MFYLLYFFNAFSASSSLSQAASYLTPATVASVPPATIIPVAAPTLGNSAIAPAVATPAPNIPHNRFDHFSRPDCFFTPSRISY